MVLLSGYVQVKEGTPSLIPLPKVATIVVVSEVLQPILLAIRLMVTGGTAPNSNGPAISFNSESKEAAVRDLTINVPKGGVAQFAADLPVSKPNLVKLTPNSAKRKGS